MAKATANGIEIEYDEFGAKDAPAVLMIMGLGAQLVRWPMALVDALVARGYRVIRYDNRDVGLSTKCDSAGTPNFALMAVSHILRRPIRAPYTLTDMAADAAGLLDALGIERAHVVGASMGGMIAQLFAAHWPERTLSLTSIMSTTGNPALPGASLQAMGILLRRPRGNDLEAIVAHGVKAAKVVGGSFPEDDRLMAERYRDEIVRNHHPSGFVRQMAAILADGDRRTRLKTIAAPTVVIHGADDPLVPAEGGRDTAAAIPGARLVEIPGMGHTLPPEVIPTVVAAFESVARPRLARAA
ncbi:MULTISPECIES: alpha/beta hydrolase [unclassified Sphingomonas]|uniref:alpha/beta fold hydrolase n=1 Tax=unclassified Sphingomonas TaxID=196159 RepID=UPI00092AE8B7|nr:MULTISPECIES: alpha/beta hydrolase [unclassified Sphingomonas]OJU15450.1 MAG: alpha/beta hydrolase [Sphingomonas sp. 66-10]